MADEKKATTTRGAQATDQTVEQTPTPATEKQAAHAKAAAKDYAPIAASDEKANPIKVELPKNAQEIAKEGTALGEAGAEATGGDAPFLQPAEANADRKWALDADHNVNLRNGGPGSNTNPDYVEFGS